MRYNVILFIFTFSSALERVGCRASQDFRNSESTAAVILFGVVLFLITFFSFYCYVIDVSKILRVYIQFVEKFESIYRTFDSYKIINYTRPTFLKK